MLYKRKNIKVSLIGEIPCIYLYLSVSNYNKQSYVNNIKKVQTEYVPINLFYNRYMCEYVLFHFTHLNATLRRSRQYYYFKFKSNNKSLHTEKILYRAELC